MHTFKSGVNKSQASVKLSIMPGIQKSGASRNKYCKNIFFFHKIGICAQSVFLTSSLTPAVCFHIRKRLGEGTIECRVSVQKPPIIKVVVSVFEENGLKKFKISHFCVVFERIFLIKKRYQGCNLKKILLDRTHYWSQKE